MADRPLSEFEHLLLLAVLRLEDEAYGLAMKREIEARVGRTVSPGAIYPTMDRLESRGLVRSSMSEPVAERGGRSRRCFTLTDEGLVELRESRAQLMAMWEGLEAALG